MSCLLTRGKYVHRFALSAIRGEFWREKEREREREREREKREKEKERERKKEREREREREREKNKNYFAKFVLFNLEFKLTKEFLFF